MRGVYAPIFILGVLFEATLGLFLGVDLGIAEDVARSGRLDTEFLRVPEGSIIDENNVSSCGGQYCNLTIDNRIIRRRL